MTTESVYESKPKMSNRVFQKLLIDLEQATFDSSMRKLAKEKIDDNYFTSEQIAKIIRLFSFDSSKLDIAKYAYKKVVDQDNYSIVFKEFDFESSIEELSEYINKR